MPGTRIERQGGKIMSILTHVRALFKRSSAQRRTEYVKDYEYAYPGAGDETAPLAELLGEVDFSHQGDLEAYVCGLSIPKEVIERWISAGLLYPEEMKTAEKMIKIMIDNERHPCH
jgi:hypothetical protein